MRKVLISALIILMVFIAANPVLAEWVSHATTSEVIVRNPIVIADAPDQPTNPSEIDPATSYVRRVTATNISASRSYVVTPQLLITYYTADGQVVVWDGINPPKSGVETGASHWVGVSVFDSMNGTYLKPGEAIILPPNVSKTFTFYVWFSGDAWPGKYLISPLFSRSEVPGKG